MPEYIFCWFLQFFLNIKHFVWIQLSIFILFWPLLAEATTSKHTEMSIYQILFSILEISSKLYSEWISVNYSFQLPCPLFKQTVVIFFCDKFYEDNSEVDLNIAASKPLFICMYYICYKAIENHYQWIFFPVFQQ